MPLEKPKTKTTTTAPRAPSSTVSAVPAVFDWPRYSRLLADVELDVFFSHNCIPFIGPLPSPNSIKTGFIAMNERLFKQAEEQSQSAQDRPRRTYLEAFNNKRMACRPFRRAVKRNLRMYVQSQAITSLFHAYYYLTDHHPNAFQTYPMLRIELTRTVFMVFASTSKAVLLEVLNDISTDDKMYGFFKDLYCVWESETSQAELETVVLRRST